MNRISLRPIGRWISMVCLAATLAACGGGGGEGDDPAVPPPDLPQADARNGDYTMMAANGKEYTLALDFDQSTYHVTGNGVDQGGAFTASGSEFRFQPGNSTGATGTSTTRFTLADEDTVVGEVGLPEGAVPFVAPRIFEDTVAGAAGRFNMLARTLNADGSVGSTGIQQGEITADGHLRLCNDLGIFEIASCPAASVVSGTITVTASLYTAQFDAGIVRFRVAKIGADKVFLRASPSAAGSTRFMIGTPATTSFAPGTFVGGTSEPAWDTVAIASGSGSSTFTFTVTSTAPDGVASTRSETALAAGLSATDSRNSLLGFTTSDAGSFFAIRSAEIAAVVAARGNTVVPGFIALGRRQ